MRNFLKMRNYLRVERGTIYTTSETVYLVKPKDGKEFSLEELQQAVGGYIENLPSLNDKEILYANEDGKLFKLAVNPHSPKVVAMYKLNPGDLPVGNIIAVYKISEEEAHDTGRQLVEEVV